MKYKGEITEIIHKKKKHEWHLHVIDQLLQQETGLTSKLRVLITYFTRACVRARVNVVKFDRL